MKSPTRRIEVAARLCGRPWWNLLNDRRIGETTLQMNVERNETTVMSRGRTTPVNVVDCSRLAATINKYGKGSIPALLVEVGRLNVELDELDEQGTG